MNRRTFLSTLGIAATAPHFACAPMAGSTSSAPRRLRRVGIQLYTLRDDARKDLERTLFNIAQAGYKDVEMLGSMNNFGMEPSRLRSVLDGNGLSAPSTHVGGAALDDLDRQLDVAKTLGHRYIVVASLPVGENPTLDDYRRWSDRLNDAGRRAQPSGIHIGFHNHASDFKVIEGVALYDLLLERTDPNLVRLQLDTGNLAMAGRDPLDYLKRFGNRYWLFHIKDVPSMRSAADTELGKGIIDFKRLLASIDHIDDKFLFVEQETYPGTPLESARRDYEYISRLDF